jgi:fatty-acyl-CoA synthase
VSLKAGQSLTADTLIAWTKERCANFRVPRYLKIVEDFEAIGITASGKVQKVKLRAQAILEFGLA